MLLPQARREHAVQQEISAPALPLRWTVAKVDLTCVSDAVPAHVAPELLRMSGEPDLYQHIVALPPCQVADLKGCSSVLFFEARKKQDCYLWVAKTPSGPCAKFHVANGAGRSGRTTPRLCVSAPQRSHSVCRRPYRPVHA